jgi:DNA-binding MarR family transcriptional regulator
MPDPNTTCPDGGMLTDDSDDGEGEDQEFAIDVELPEDSLFTLEDYLEMYETAASQPAFDVLTALSEEGRLSASEMEMMLDREGNDLHYHLRKLKRSALIKNRRDPNTGTKETYSYYELTDLAHVILTEGLATGVQKLAAEEATISEKYGE